MPMRSEIAARPLLLRDKGALDRASSLIPSRRDLLAIGAFVVVGLLFSIWLDIQFPFIDAVTAIQSGAGP
jgi:hypothetical protein